MIKKYILATVAILLAVWVGFFFGNKSANAPEGPVNGEVEQVATTTPVVQQQAPTQKTTQTTIAPKTTTSAPAIAKDGSYLVYYTNRGFNPSPLTIKTGKSVRFVNNSSKAMSLTSTSVDNQAQSEFNQGKTVGQGGVYDFTFMSAGTWGYMNRNNQTDRGTIIVQ
ncbi:MAG: cupredoxin domain-containing protein [Minisyncoccia bacterium]